MDSDPPRPPRLDETGTHLPGSGLGSSERLGRLPRGGGIYLIKPSGTNTPNYGAQTWGPFECKVVYVIDERLAQGSNNLRPWLGAEPKEEQGKTKVLGSKRGRFIGCGEPLSQPPVKVV